MATKSASKSTVKKTAPKKTTTKKTVAKGNKISRKSQFDSSKLIMIGTAIVILLVLAYIVIEYVFA